HRRFPREPQQRLDGLGDLLVRELREAGPPDPVDADQPGLGEAGEVGAHGRRREADPCGERPGRQGWAGEELLEDAQPARCGEHAAELVERVPACRRTHGPSSAPCSPGARRTSTLRLSWSLYWATR